MPRSVFAAAAFLLATTGAGATAAGTPAGDPAVGEAVAGMICARCHDIASSTRPGSQPRVPAKPPAFVDIAQDPTRTAAWFRRFLRIPHGHMDNVVLTATDIDNVSAYILAMRKSTR